MDSLKDNWQKILETVKNEYSIKEMLFKTWLAPLTIVEVNEKDLVLGYPSSGSMETDESFLSSHIMKHYGLQLKVAIEDATGVSYDIKVKLVGSEEKKPEKTSSVSHINSNINEIYTFSNFVVGGNNRFAQQAALAVAETPGELYNPLYIYGGPGLGKTHLLHAIGNYILEENPNTKVLYVTSETFTNEVIESMRTSNVNTKAMTNFREKYRMVDVLMIDDIQFIIGKEQTQEEFFHTFNTLKEAKKQIIITSDQSPKEMRTLEERFRTRFEMGLMADIGLPEYELRMAILQKKSEEKNFRLSDEVINYVATNVKSNIRELEGALNKLMAVSRLTNTEVTMDIAQKELHNIIDPDKPREITPQTIIEIVCEHFSVALDQMTGKSRSNDISRPRQIAMYLCKTMTECSLEVIGSFLGGRNHSTIIHGVQKIADEYETDSDLKNQIDVIKKKIRPS
ncbi:MAG: chromosomal replication initiator protein DnaA [Lachnospiraceae bacterium]|nr:chromosomal replication initiator protein DnaA [Lachnospiraceae bacterium]